MHPPIIVAHRGGARGKHRENTLEAFSYAIQNGFQCVEMDIRLDWFKKRFYLEHDFLHLPRVKANVLEKVITAFPKNITLFMELKTYTLTRTFYAQTFCSFLKTHNLEEQAIVISFNPFILGQIRKIVPQMKLGFLCGSRFTYYLLKPYWKKKIRPDYFIFSKRILNKKRVKEARKAGYKVFTYVINKESEWQEAHDLKLDGIITDYPEKAARFLKHLR